VHFLRGENLGGITAWNSRLRACLAEPPAESPSTRKISDCAGSPEVQSASLPGSAGPEVMRLRATCLADFSRAWALAMQSSASFSASAVC
jgi:hypothetical protein